MLNYINVQYLNVGDSCVIVSGANSHIPIGFMLEVTECVQGERIEKSNLFGNIN